MIYAATNSLRDGDGACEPFLIEFKDPHRPLAVAEDGRLRRIGARVGRHVGDLDWHRALCVLDHGVGDSTHERRAAARAKEDDDLGVAIASIFGQHDRVRPPSWEAEGAPDAMQLARREIDNVGGVHEQAIVGLEAIT